MVRFHRCFFAILALMVFVPQVSATNDVEVNAVDIFGWVERVELLDGKFDMKAKLDTGAATSSLDATGIEQFRKDGERWVRFTVTGPETGDTVVLERPLVRNVRIVRHNGAHQRRAVVQLPICLGKHRREVEFSLIDRSNFIYPVLLGRSALDDVALIDSASTFANYPACEADGVAAR